PSDTGYALAPLPLPNPSAEPTPPPAGPIGQSATPTEAAPSTPPATGTSTEPTPTAAGSDPSVPSTAPQPAVPPPDPQPAPPTADQPSAAAALTPAGPRFLVRARSARIDALMTRHRLVPIATVYELTATDPALAEKIVLTAGPADMSTDAIDAEVDQDPDVLG